MAKQYIDWEDANFTWSGNDYIWNEVYLDLSNILAGKGGVVKQQKKLDDWTKKNPDKKKKLIKLLCQINDLKYKYEDSKEKKDVKIKIQDVKILVKKMEVILNVEK